MHTKGLTVVVGDIRDDFKKLVPLVKKVDVVIHLAAQVAVTTSVENPSEDFCREKKIPILGCIPFDKNIGTMTSDAKIAADESLEYSDLFKGILENLRKAVSDEAALDTER